MASLRMLLDSMAIKFRQFYDGIWFWSAFFATLFILYFFFFSGLSSYIANLSTEGMIRSSRARGKAANQPRIFVWPRKKPITVIGTAAEATKRKGEITMIVQDCVADELRHLDNHIADTRSTLQGRLPSTLRQAINDSVTSLVKARIHKANDELLSKMVVGAVCPEENVVRTLQQKVDDLDRLVHGLSKSDSEPNQLELIVKQQSETSYALAEKVDILMSVNTVNEDKFSKLQTTVDDQALQVANIPKIMADISAYETHSKDIAMPDAQPTVNTEFITVIETKIHALETALKSANASIDAQTSAFENRIEQIEDSVKEVTTDRNTLPSNDRVEKIEATLFDSTGITRQVEMLDNRIRAQECLPRVPPSLATKLGALELNIENLGTRMKNYEDAVTDVRQNYHGFLDAIDGIKRTVQESVEGLDAVRAQIEKMRKHIDAIDDDLAKDDKRMQALKNMVQTLDQKVKADSEDLTKLYRRVGECEDAYLRLSGEADAQCRPSSPLAPIDESSSEEDHDVNTTMATKDSGDSDIASTNQTPVDGVKAEHTGITEDFTASTVNNEAVNDGGLKDADPGLTLPPNVGEGTGITEDITASTSSFKEAMNDEDTMDTDTGSVRPPNAGEDTGIAEDPKASTSDKEAVNDEATMDTDPGSTRPPSVGDNLTKDLLSGYKRSDEESGSNGSEGHGSGSVPAVQPQHVSSGEVDAGKADAAGEKDDKDGVE